MCVREGVKGIEYFSNLFYYVDPTQYYWLNGEIDQFKLEHRNRLQCDDDN